jgi:hypothetical protein
MLLFVLNDNLRCLRRLLLLRVLALRRLFLITLMFGLPHISGFIRLRLAPMVLLSVTKLVLLLMASSENMVVIMMRLLLYCSHDYCSQLHTLLVVASVHEWYIDHVDVKNVFLNGELREKVYM